MILRNIVFNIKDIYAEDPDSEWTLLRDFREFSIDYFYNI